MRKILLTFFAAILCAASMTAQVDAPLTFEATEAGATVTYTLNETAPIQYSLNGGAWTNYSAAITLANVGDKVYFRGDNALYDSNSAKFKCSADCYIYGNIMSLVDAENYATATTLTENYTFYSMFYNNTHIKNHPSKDLVLPATTLAEDCYGCMFWGCSGLTSAPELPATTLANNCYDQMFRGCTGLTSAPELPATTLANYCYRSMFQGCTGLTSAPELPATTLANNCYYAMFIGCTGLTNAPELPATTLANYCYYYMFQGCTGLTSAPELPATTLLYYCYAGMFKDCTNLSAVTCYAATTASYSTTDWLNGVAASGTFYAPTNGYFNHLARGVSSIPEGWTINTDRFEPLTFEAMEAGATVTYTLNETAPIQYSLNGGAWTDYSAAITLANVGDKVSFRGSNNAYNQSNLEATFQCDKDCYIYGNIMSLVSATEYATATTLSENNTFYRMFYNNTHIKNHPSNDLVLPATTLAKECYAYMFRDCTGLTRAPELPATTLAYSCYSAMFFGCTGLTSAPELPATTLATSCYSSMFSGCSGLTNAPALPATTLADYCYQSMFYWCTALTSAPELPATTLANLCYISMFQDCTDLTSAPELPATTLANNCYQDMFRGCTSLTSAPELPATTLALSCYSYMFNGCTGLTSAPELPATTLANLCYRSMFQGCTNLSSVTCYATVTATNATTDWLNNVAASGTYYAPTDGVLNYEDRGASSIPEGWDIVIVPIYIDANFAIDFRSNPYAVVGGGALPAGVEVTGEFNDGQHGYYEPVISIPVKAGNYLVKMGACQYSNQDGTVTNEDGTVTYATLATNTGVCYDANPAKNYVAAIITIPSDQIIKVNGAQYTPYFSISKMPEIPAFTDFEMNLMNLPEAFDGSTLPTGVTFTGDYVNDAHGYRNLVVTVPAEAGTYRLTLGTCQYGNTGTGIGNVMSETNVELATFDQKTSQCYHQNTATNIVSTTFTVDMDQHIIIKCGQYTPYLKLEKISAYAVTFALGDAEGVAPAAADVTIGESITMPVNKTMYKDDYTLTAWTDGVDTYSIGEDFTPTSDAALTPVFAANEADLLNAGADVTVKWYFGESNGAPSVHWEGNSGLLVAQALIGGKTVDVKLAIDAASGKFYNVGRGDQWAQVNANTVFNYPYKEGMTVSVSTNSGNATYDLSDGTLTCKTNDYYSYIELTFPGPTDMDIAAKEDPLHPGVYYSTFYHSGADYTLPAGVEAYKAVIDNEALKLTKVAVAGQSIPAGNAVILKSDIQNYTLTASAATSSTFDDNSLQGVDVATVVSSVVPSGSTCYVLSGNSTNGVGFFTFASDKTLGAHKAYVVIGSGSGAPKRLRFVFEGENSTTGISNVQGDNVQSTKVIENGVLYLMYNGAKYNVQGQIVK